MMIILGASSIRSTEWTQALQLVVMIIFRLSTDIILKIGCIGYRIFLKSTKDNRAILPDNKSIQILARSRLPNQSERQRRRKKPY